ncbi:hypothetical protein GCM10010990_36180 [Croceicoccus mobilis]|uniref:Uncharacterized protein n=2 Tax=Croceicoccus mobilis TaxID=1703339 RepID=A0A917DZY1_9SPHN|nr:hypothetical protein GCM10010990_36180 [Croceicoccus mobilis]
MPVYRALYGRHGVGVEDMRPVIALNALAAMAYLKHRQPNRWAELHLDGEVLCHLRPVDLDRKAEQYRIEFCEEKQLIARF